MAKYQTLCTFLILTWSYMAFITFWTGIVFGYAYFAFFNKIERSWHCYAPQDGAVLEPWNF